MSELKLWGEVPKGFRALRIGEISSVQTGPFGSQLHKEDYVDDGIPIVTVEHLGENFFTHQNLPRVTAQDAERLSKYTLRAGDIVFSRVGSVDRRALVRDSEDGWLFSGRCLRIRPDPEFVCSRYLSYFLGHPGVRDYIRSIAVGATMPSLNTRLLSDIPVYLPALPEQRIVGEILGSLDEKIELNRQTARTLEELAQRLFKSWFVDFDPVRAKMAGRQPAHTPPEIANLFPDRLIDSPLGPIPEGWKIKVIEDIVTIKGGATPSTKEEAFWNGGTYHWATPKDLSGLQQKVLITTDRKITSAGVEKISSGQLPPGSVLMSSRAPVGYLALADMPVSINQGFIAMICDQGVPNTFVLHWAEANIDVIKSNAGGSTFAEISKKQFRPLELIVPPEKLLRTFDEMAADWFQRVSQLARENISLAELRDRLLPKLISGEIRVPEARELAEESAS